MNTLYELSIKYNNILAKPIQGKVLKRGNNNTLVLSNLTLLSNSFVDLLMLRDFIRNIK